MLVYDEIAQQVVLHRKKIDEKLTNCDDGTEVVFEGGTQPLQKELQHFLDRVEDRGTPMSDGSSSVSVIRVLERASQELARTASGIRTGQKQISQAG